jgi:hypothetical protein
MDDDILLGPMFGRQSAVRMTMNRGPAEIAEGDEVLDLPLRAPFLAPAPGPSRNGLISVQVFHSR